MNIVKWRGGGIPFGYKFDKQLRMLIIEPNDRNLLSYIFDLAMRDYSLKEISEHLNDRKINSRKRKEWSYKTLSYLFQEDRIKFYAGFNKEMIKGNWIPIIKEDYAKKLISMNIISKKAKQIRSRVSLLTNLDMLKCSYCGGPMKSGASTSSSNEKIYYYLCSNKTIKYIKKCPYSKMIRQDLLNKIVIDQLKFYKSNFHQFEKRNSNYLIKELEDINTRIAVVDSKISKTLAKFSAGETEKVIEEIIIQLKKLIDDKGILHSLMLKTCDIESLQKIDLNIYNVSITKEAKNILPQFIAEIEVDNERIRLKFRFPIDDLLNDIMIFER